MTVEKMIKNDNRSFFRMHQEKGPWVSLGIHLDFQRWFVDIHFGWWIITVGYDYHVPIPSDDEDIKAKHISFVKANE
jgi:hypothetical protein